MKQSLWFLAGCLALFSFSTVAYASHGKPMTRAGFIKLVVSQKFSQGEIDACDKSRLPFGDVSPRFRSASSICMAYQNGFIKRNNKFRPAAPVTLAEAAAILTAAFDLEVPQYTPFPGTWYQSYLLALEMQNAIPISFWTPADIVTRIEALEMISRLADGMTAKPSMTFEALHLQRTHYRAVDFLRLEGDFKKPLAGSFLTPKILAFFQEPGTYYITDIDHAEQDDQNYCHNYYTQSGTRGNVTLETQGDNATITIEALSTDYCNIGQAKPYTISLEKKGNELFVKGAENNRIRIERAPIEKICRQFADGCPAGFYDYTKVETTGTLNTVTTNGEVWNVYTTAWKPIFSDLRGVPFIQAEEDFGDGKQFKKIYEAPNHNRNGWGRGILSYEECLTDTVASSLARGYSYHFCIKRAGNFFIVASQKELGDKATFWIDENFRR